MDSLRRVSLTEQYAHTDPTRVPPRPCAQFELLKFDIEPGAFQLIQRKHGFGHAQFEIISGNEQTWQMTQICGSMNGEHRKKVCALLRASLPAYCWNIFDEDMDDLSSAILRELENDALLIFMQARMLFLIPSFLMWALMSHLDQVFDGCGAFFALKAQEQHPLTAIRLTTPSAWDLQSFCLHPGAQMVIEFSNETWINAKQV